MIYSMGVGADTALVILFICFRYNNIPLMTHCICCEEEVAGYDQ